MNDAHVHAAFCTFREDSAGRDTLREVREAVVIGMCLTSLELPVSACVCVSLGDVCVSVRDVCVCQSEMCVCIPG